MNRVIQLIGKYGKQLKEQYGFVADERLPLWERVERRIGEINVEEMCTQPTIMASQNLLQIHTMPSGTTKLLGLGLNYCVKSTTTKETTKNNFNRLTEDVQRIYTLRDEENDEGNYIPSLYIKSDYQFQPASKEIKLANNKTSEIAGGSQ